ncbi:MAG: tetratricopeptide repeat protein [Cyclobacteriaceae bacterium]|nr:tetratricopeptide repeat protein [Cyclobacteriaceae bacterium]
MQKVTLPILLSILLASTICYCQNPKIDSIQRFIEKHTRDTNEIKALSDLSIEFMRKDMNQAKLNVYKQIALAKILRTDFGLASGYSGLVAMHQNEGAIDSAQYYLHQLEILAKNPTNKKAAVNYANSAGLFYKNQGRLKEALPYLVEALRLLENGDKTARAGQMLNVGNTYYNLGELKMAADYHLKALTLFEVVKNKRGQSFCLNSLGNDYLDLKQYDAAEKYFFQSEKLKEELGDKRGVITTWMSLGVVYQQTNKEDRAMLYFNKALTRARELKLSLEESRLLFNIGSLLKQTKKNEEASKNFSAALVLARQSGDSALVSRIKTYIISLKNEEQKEIKQEQTLLQNVKISLESGAIDNVAEGYFELAKWYESRNQFDKALKNLKLGQQLTDSVKGSQVIYQLKRLEEEYQTDKKEKEIALLKKDQELQTLALSRQRVIITLGIIAFIAAFVIAVLLINRYRVLNRSKRLLEIEKVRNNIARDLHDDMGSALSSINILSQVALVEKNGNTQSYLQRIGEQSARMMEDMSDMVWSINPRNDSMSQVLIRMREFASEIFELKNIEYQFIEKGIEQLMLNADQRKNIFLIFKEAINNAAKYSGANRVEIGLHQRGSVLEMAVSDNGQGFDEQTIKAGNGLRNMRERAKEIKGNLELRSAMGKGTEIVLSVPIA